MGHTDTAARETVAYWVLVELRAAMAQAKTHTVRASERYIAADRDAAGPAAGLDGDVWGPDLGQVRTM